MDRFGSDFGAYHDRSETEDCASEPGPADHGAFSNPPPSPVGQDERRMQVRAYNHWSSLLGRANLPLIEDLEPEFLGDFGPYSVLLDFSTGSGTPTIQFIGRELQRECCALDPIEDLQEIPAGSLLSKIADNYLRVVQEQGPVSFEAESANAHGQSIAYRGILLPYSSDQDTIDFVYAVINWKEVADAQTADALLAEIDRAMDYGLTEIPAEGEATPAHTADIVHFHTLASAAEEEPECTGGADFAEEEADPWERDDNILDLRYSPEDSENAFDDLPRPSFGDHDDTELLSEAANVSTDPDLSLSAPQDEKVDESMAYDIPEAAPETPKRARQTDALGNPIGGAPADDFAAESNAGGITSAADYGLPEWDDDEEEEDVDELINPLANIDLNSRLLALVNSGSRGKKTVDLATLSEAQAEEEGESAGFDRSLFRPKAPSVDTLLSPEPYEDEDEDEGEYAEADDEAFDASLEVAAEAEALEPETTTADEAELELSSHEQGEEQDEEPVALEIEYDEFDGQTGACAANGDASESARLDAVIELVEEFHSETEEEPFELGEEFVAHETSVEMGDASEAREVVEAEKPVEFEDVLELAEVVEDAPVAERLPEVVAVETADSETGLTGLLAAVQELSEAARTTEDAERRALYEAVARAFDVSIKAVVATGKPSRDVVEEFPLDGISRTGPDLALVMVRRHANGDTEVLGEVPHDRDLMENAQRRIASR